ncbi:hypothetical protein THARTR1_06945 [Trichoderma harzianum]|uniref:DUF6546 domain-containing protein n=1 Tax=Trichoderma harzianum TaxID=5544 RepID=A0A2K0U3Y1_TRIHA|nr:hypothetical protein THARTR1_06945 [Trichoderma harzianum]
MGEVEGVVVQIEAVHIQVNSPRKSKGKGNHDSIQSGKARASVYATVCKEWYDYFEPYIFRRLTLSMKRLSESEAIITGSRCQFVQHIWLRFERSVQPGVTPVKLRHELDALRFNATIFQLFQILSEWPERSIGQPGIALELTAFSAADPDYSMKDTVPDELKGVDLTVDSEPLNAIYEMEPSARRRLTEHEENQQFELHPFYVPRKHPSLTTLRLPVVRLITDLTIRRQMHISFFTHYVNCMVDSLPNLEFVTYEPLALNFITELGHENEEAVKSIITKMPSSIRRLQVFEDGPGLWSGGIPSRYVSDRDGSLGRLVAEVSQDKEPEVISISFIIDAVNFFSDFQTPQISRPHWKLGWLNLTSIVLTSAVMSPWRTAGIPPLLLSAARAARHMPKLEIMELYNITWNSGAIFTYIHDSTGSILCWDSTWKWKLPPGVISVWKRVADVHGTKVFEHEENMIKPTGSNRRGWSGDAIMSLLRTKTTVVHPITYGNMMDGRNFM